MSEYYLKYVTPEQKKVLSDLYKITDWRDGSVNVHLKDADEVDAFVDWCEEQGLDPELK